MDIKQKFFRLTHRKSHYFPDYIAGQVTDIDITALQKLHIRAMILDIDDTLVVRRGATIDARVVKHLGKIRRAGIKLYIGSNTKRDISALANSIKAGGIDRVWWHYKPMKIFFRHILADIKLPPEQVVMVGDRIVNDTIGANRVGLHTILVTPIGRQPGPFARWYWNKLI